MKRTLSCLLVALLLFAGIVPAVSATKPHDEATCDKIPIIYCEGAWHSLYSKPGTPEQEEYWTTGGGGSEIISDLQKLLPEFPKYIQDEEWDKIADILADFVNKLFYRARFDENGESVEPLGGNENKMLEELSRNHKGDPNIYEYCFNYDWRQDPWILAEQLKTHIERVCAATGHSTVNIAAQSGSGCIMMAYLARYGTAHLRAITIRATLHKGSTVFGDMVNKRIYIDNDALAKTGFLRAFDIADNEKISNMLIAANQAGLLKAVLATVNRAFPRIVDRLYEKGMVPAVLRMPMFWAYVPNADYESGKAICFGNQRGNYSELIRKLDRYHYNVQLRSDDLLKEASQKIRVGLYLGDNSPLTPITKNSNLNGDGFVDTTFASLGATVAEPYGKKLGMLGVVFQKNKDGHKHISPDKTIDASTCLLPEQTWFVRDISHIGTSNENFVRWFFSAKKTPTVFSDPAYPQFLVLDDSGDDDIFRPEEKLSFWQQAGAALNPVARMKDLVFGIVNFIITLGTWWIK
ncbi:MAG: hypothetical protein LBJ12_09825 [Oscillospiraceae bacterium]|jgi:hypothetical protein|nr:hypothetical protein [Oscillospiraceae bacterium]